jgi:hypothetical protein
MSVPLREPVAPRREPLDKRTMEEVLA